MALKKKKLYEKVRTQQRQAYPCRASPRRASLPRMVTSAGADSWPAARRAPWSRVRRVRGVCPALPRTSQGQSGTHHSPASGERRLARRPPSRARSRAPSVAARARVGVRRVVTVCCWLHVRAGQHIIKHCGTLRTCVRYAYRYRAQTTSRGNLNAEPLARGPRCTHTRGAADQVAAAARGHPRSDPEGQQTRVLPPVDSPRALRTRALELASSLAHLALHRLQLLLY